VCSCPLHTVLHRRAFGTCNSNVRARRCTSPLFLFFKVPSLFQRQFRKSGFGSGFHPPHSMPDIFLPAPFSEIFKKHPVATGVSPPQWMHGPSMQPPLIPGFLRPTGFSSRALRPPPPFFPRRILPDGQVPWSPFRGPPFPSGALFPRRELQHVSQADAGSSCGHVRRPLLLRTGQDVFFLGGLQDFVKTLFDLMGLRPSLWKRHLPRSSFHGFRLS